MSSSSMFRGLRLTSLKPVCRSSNIYKGNNKLLSQVRFGGGGDMPPFGRLRPPSTMLPEEVELVWNDSVAPETCIDFDAPHVSNSQAVASFLGGLGFFAFVYFCAWLSDPETNAAAAGREVVLSDAAFRADMGLDDDEEEGEEDDDE